MTDVSELLKAAAADQDTTGVSAFNPMQTFAPPTPPSILDQKKEAVAAASDAKMLDMGGLPNPKTFRNAAIIRQTGSGATSSTNEIERDLASLNSNEIRQKYGFDRGNDLIAGLVRAQNQFRNELSGTRTDGDVAYDMTSGVALGAASMVGGLAALGLSGADAAVRKATGLNSRMGVWAAGKVQDMNEAVQDTQSPVLALRRQADQAQTALDSRDHQAQFDEDVQNGDSKLFAGLKEIGRDVLTVTKNTVQSPELLSDLAAQAGGSLIGTGPLAKGLGLIGSKIVPSASKGVQLAAEMDRGLGVPSLARVVDRTSKMVPSKILPGKTAVAVGLQEASGAYQQTAAEIAKMPFEELEKNSPFYRDLVSQGVSPDDARNQAADNAGQMAAGIAAPAGLVGGKFTEKLLEHPFVSKTAGHAVSNILKETVEEGVQGATGQLAQNIGTQAYADETKRLQDGVGQQIAQGALGGGLSGAGVQAPSIAAHAARATGKAALDAVTARVDKNAAKNEAASPSSSANLSAASTSLSETMSTPEARNAIANAVHNAPEDRKAAMENLADKITKLGVFSPEEISIEGMSSELKETLNGTKDRVNALLHIAGEVSTKGADTAEGLSAARELSKQLEHYDALTKSDERAFGDIPDKHAAGVLAERFNKLGDAIVANPTVLAALKAVKELKPEQIEKLVKPVTEENLKTPEGQQNIENAAALAKLSPDNANLAVNQQILEHAKNGKVQLTQDQHQALMASVALMKASSDSVQRQKDLGHVTPLNSVSEDVLTRGGNKDDVKRSATDYSQRIFQNMRAGNVAAARAELENFGHFVTHMTNKSDAVNQHYAQGGGDKVSFQARNPVSNEFYATTGNQLQGVTPTSPKSVEYAQRVNLEAKRVADIYNGLSKAFPELNAGEKTVADLHENLQGKPRDVAQAHRTGEVSRAAQNDQPKTTSNQTTTEFRAEIAPKEEIAPPGSSEARAAEVAPKTVATPDVRQDVKGAKVTKTESKAEATTGTNATPTAERSDEGAKAEKPTFKAFEPESGTLGIPRENMPQIRSSDHGALTNFLNARGIEHETKSVPSENLKPTQAEFSPENVAHQQENGSGNRSVIITQDGHVVDGHHQWLAAKENGEPIKAIELKTDVHTAMDAMHQFPSAKPPAEGIAPTRVEPKSTKEAYPDLVGTKESKDSPLKNWFHAAFQVPKEGAQAISRLFGEANPLLAVRQALSSEKRLPNEISAAFQGYLSMVPLVAQTMEARLQAKLEDVNDPKSPAANLLAGKSNRWAETRVFNLVEQKPDGSFSYNRPLLESSILAGLHWLLNTNQFRSDMDADLVHTLTGISIDRADRFVDMLDVGLSPVEAVRSLGSRIQSFWGVKSNDSVGIGHTDGIPQAMAAEVLKAFQETLVDGKESLLKVQKFVVDGDTLRPLTEGETTTKRTAQRLVPNLEMRDAKTGHIDPLFAAASLIEKIALTTPTDKTFYAGDKMPVAERQMNSPVVENTPDQKSMIETAQAQPYRVSERMFKLFSAIGEKGLLDLFGGGPNLEKRVEAGTVNAQHALTLDGRNTTVRSAWNALQQRVAEMKNLPDGLSTAIHYAFNVSSVGRLQMLGGQTPQLSKLIREAILPTWSTLDLQKNQEHQQFFNLALAQALGVKVHANTTEAINTKLEDLLQNKFPKSIELLQDHLGSKNGSLSQDFVNTLKNEFKAAGEDLTPVALHALMEHARFTNATETEKAKFETALYLEADGVTNGVANAIRMLTADRFTADQLENMAKTGQFFANAMTMNEHRAQDNVDLYSKAASKHQENLDALYQGNPDLRNHMSHVFSLFSQLVPGVAYNADTGAVVVDRGVTKNPMTMMIYGAGAKSVSVKLADVLSRAFYEKLSDVAQARKENPGASFAELMFGDAADPESRFKQFTSALNAVTTLKVNRNREGLFLEQTGEKRLTSLDPAKFTLSDGQFKAIQENILHLFVHPMRNGITETMGQSVTESSKLVQESTQLQSVVLEHLFKQRIEELQAQKAKDLNWSVTDGLSQSDIKGVLKSLLKQFPLIDTGKQVFFPVNSDTSDLKSTSTSGLNGEFKTSPQIYGPSDAGVKGGPMLNIGMGDGSMIQHMLSALKTPGLPVFDGFNFALDKISEGSVKANEAASEAWKGNSLRAVLDSFKVFNAALDLKTLANPELTKSLFKSLGLNWAQDNKPGETIKRLADHMEDQLSKGADMIDARQKVIAETQNYVDQMAGAQRPFMNEGHILSGSFEDQARALNARLDERAKAPQISDLQHVEARFTLEQRQVWNLVQSIGGLDGFRIETHSDHPSISSNADGVIDFGNNVIRLKGADPEALVHEAVHAATFRAVLAHYEGENLGPRTKEVQEAIGRLEKLMDQFQKLDVSDTLKTAPDFVDALRAINDHLERGDAQGKAAALNEFMAWALANKGLASTLKATPSLVQMAKDVWQQIKTIVFGKNLAPKVGNDMYSHILFNTAVLMQEQPNVAAINRNVSLFQNRAYGTNDRISELNTMFDQMFSRHLKTGDPVLDRRRGVDLVQTQTDSADLVKLANAQGFYMDAQARNAFTSTVEALALHTKLDPNALTKIDELYRHVTKNLTREMLIDKTDPDPLRAESVAQMKFDMLLGHAGTKTDAQGRSSLLPVFLGLSLADEGFRNVLRDMDLPKTKQKQGGTLDTMLSNLASSQMESLANTLAGQGKAKNVSDAIDNLTRRLGENAVDTRSTMEEISLAPNTLTNRANDAFVSWLERVTDKAIDKARDVKANTKNDFVKKGADVAEFISGMLTTKNGALQAEGVQSAINRMTGMTSFRELISDMIGRTKSNASVYDMIKQATAMVGQVRQQFREHLPSYLAEQFSRKLDNTEWSALHQAMGKTDLSVLADQHSSEDVLKMLADPRERRTAVRTLEAFLKSEDAQHFGLVQTKAQQLADYMTSGKIGTNLLRNAEAVSALHNERNVSQTRKDPSSTYVKAVDQLTTLYALEKLSPEVQASMTSLVQDEGKGMDFTLNYMRGLRTDEMSKATGMAKFNAFKGYIPAHQQQGVSLVIAADSDAPSLLSKSYVRVADYTGSNVEGSYSSRGYYFAPVSGRAAFSQGIVQNAAHTAGGVEIATGRSQSLTGGLINNPVIVDRIAKQLHREGATNENLMPIFNDQGKVVAFERGVDPTQLSALNADTHLGRMMGTWHGRQVEEAISGEFNKSLVDKLLDMYKSSSKDDKANAYIDLFDAKTYGNDPVIRDALSLMTPDTREYIKNAFGDQFMVRKDMLNDVIGYRKASVGDAWTGNTRWSPQTQKSVRDLAIAAFGNKAYANMVNAEGIWQEGVSIAKMAIVVKSVIVPVSNFASNLLQLAGRGVSMNDMIKGIPRKIAEAEAYTKGRLEKIEAEGQLRVAEGAQDFNAQRKLKARIQSIDDGFRRLSIWPLIEAGEFGAISHLDISRDDVQLMQGKLHEYISSLVDKLPTAVQNAGRYAWIGKDTALFQGLAKAVEYGDFLGKSLQYEHLINKKGLSQKEALGRITEEYVNFDRLPGRSRGYLESMGLMWFMNFKLRSTKVALSMIRENPLQALIGSMMPVHRSPVGNLGTPIQDNLIAKAFSGTLGYSLGPGMMFHAPMLHPVGHLLGKL